MFRAIAMTFAMVSTACVPHPASGAAGTPASADAIVSRYFISRTKDQTLFQQAGILWEIDKIQQDLSAETSNAAGRYVSVATNFKKDYAGLWGSITRASDPLLLLKSDPLTSCGNSPLEASQKVVQETADKIDYDVTYKFQRDDSRFSRTIRVILLRQQGKWVIDNVVFPPNTFPMLGSKQDFRYSLSWLTTELDEASKWAAEHRGSLQTQEQLLKRVRSGN